MLARCYDDETQKKNPTYVGCIVCDEWHNFQRFAKWYEDNHPRDGKKYHIDKDIKVKGNRVYGQDTCIFVTPKQNIVASVAKEYEFLSPSGEVTKIINLSEFCKKNNLCISTMVAVNNGRRKQHKGWKSKQMDSGTP